MPLVPDTDTFTSTTEFCQLNNSQGKQTEYSVALNAPLKHCIACLTDDSALLLNPDGSL
jgi:hypothetical protein